MATLKERVLEAALEVLGTRGIHALSHSRVDAVAGLPRGSTSNYFRTRAALLDGVVERLLDSDRATWERLSNAELSSADGVAEALAQYVEAATDTDRVRSVARYTLFAESLVNPQVREPLRRARTVLEEQATAIMRALGASDPRSAALQVFRFVDGLIMHRLTFGADVHQRETLATIVAGAITDAGTPE